MERSQIQIRPCTEFCLDTSKLWD